LNTYQRSDTVSAVVSIHTSVLLILLFPTGDKTLDVNGVHAPVRGKTVNDSHIAVKIYILRPQMGLLHQEHVHTLHSAGPSHTETLTRYYVSHYNTR